MSGKPPIKKFQSNGIDVCIWQGSYEGKTTYSASVKKQKFNKQSNSYEDTDFLNPSDLPVMAKLLEMGFAFITELKANNRQNNQGSQGNQNYSQGNQGNQQQPPQQYNDPYYNYNG